MSGARAAAAVVATSGPVEDPGGADQAGDSNIGFLAACAIVDHSVDELADAKDLFPEVPVLDPESVRRACAAVIRGTLDQGGAKLRATRASGKLPGWGTLIAGKTQ